jgi:hypothetical protein
MKRAQGRDFPFACRPEAVLEAVCRATATGGLRPGRQR